MERLKFSFTRTGEFIDIGYCTIDVEDPNDESEVEQKLASGQYAEFLVGKRIVLNDEVEFDELELDASN